MLIYDLVSYFFIYAFLGWVVEVAFLGITKHVLANRGFLNGPVCPIYGVGMNFVIVMLSPIANNIPLLFLLGMIITSVIELVAGWMLDKLFHMRWWDYSNEPYNLKGYICLPFSFMWGFGVLFIMKIVHPFVAWGVDKVPFPLGLAVNIIFTILIIVDLVVTYKEVIGITRSLGEAEKIAAKLKEVSDNISTTVGTTAISTSEAVSESRERMSEAVSESREKMTEAFSESRERMSEAVSESRERMAEAVSERREKVATAVSSILEKTTLDDKIIDEYHKQKMELEDKYADAVAQLHRKTERMSRAFPKWHMSYDTKPMKEYINHMTVKYSRKKDDNDTKDNVC